MITKGEISLVRSLEEKRHRQQHGLFVAQGAKVVGEVLASGFQVEALFCVGPMAEYPGACQISWTEMERMSSLKTPPQVLALVRIPDLPTMDLSTGLTLALDGVQDPGNLGTIIRIADWYGIRNILCSQECADCYSPKVVQATMGALLRVNLYYGPLERVLEQATQPILGTMLGGSDIYTSDIPRQAIIVMGSEGRGISPAIEALVSQKLYIPHFPPNAPPSSESLNVAVATAIICAEARRVHRAFY